MQDGDLDAELAHERHIVFDHHDRMVLGDLLQDCCPQGFSPRQPVLDQLRSDFIKGIGQIHGRSHHQHHGFHLRLTSQASAVAMLRLSLGLIG